MKNNIIWQIQWYKRLRFLINKKKTIGVNNQRKKNITKLNYRQQDKFIQLIINVNLILQLIIVK